MSSESESGSASIPPESQINDGISSVASSSLSKNLVEDLIKSVNTRISNLIPLINTSNKIQAEDLKNQVDNFNKFIKQLTNESSKIQAEDLKNQVDNFEKFIKQLINESSKIQAEGLRLQADNGNKIIKPQIDAIFKIQTDGLKTQFDNVNTGINKLNIEIKTIRTGIKEGSGDSEVKIPSIQSLSNKLDKIPFSIYNFLIFVLPQVILFFILLIIIGLIVIKTPSLNSVNTRIDNLSTSITENSPNSQIQKLKGDTTDIKNGLVELNKKGVVEIKDLIVKIGNPATLSNDIVALKTSVDKLSTNLLNKKDLDEIKIMLKNIADNKPTTSAPQFIGQPTESLRFAKELSAEILKAKGFTDEIAKSSNQVTKDALKSVDDKIKLISDSIKINAKTDKTEESLKSIDEKFKTILESINRNPKTEKAVEDKFNKLASELDTLKKSLNTKTKHPFLLICSTSLNFNPVKLDKLGPLFKDISETIAINYSGIDWKMGIERAGQYTPWFDNKGNNNTVVETKLKFTSYVGATPDFTTNFLTIDILKNVLNNDIFSDIIIIVPPDIKPTALKNLDGTPIFMNGSRVHVIFLSFLANGTITQTMVDWSKLCGANGGGAFSIFYFKEPIFNENDFSNKLKDHVLRLVHKFN